MSNAGQKSWSQSLGHFGSQSVYAVVLDNDATCVELAKSCQNVSLSDAHVPELTRHFSSAFSSFFDLGDHQNEASIGVKTV